MLDYRLAQGGVDAIAFREFVEKYLPRHVMPFDVINSHIIVIMDNASISDEYNGRQSAKIRARWLHGRPSYSWPDMMTAYLRLPIIIVAMHMASNYTGRQWSVVWGCQ
jgi:hypothetical protein